MAGETGGRPASVVGTQRSGPVVAGCGRVFVSDSRPNPLREGETAGQPGVGRRSVNPSRKLPRFESWICHQRNIQALACKFGAGADLSGPGWCCAQWTVCVLFVSLGV